jgi:hypothetical protein
MTSSGAPAQKIASVPGQRYGEGVAQQAMQRQMPAPDNRAPGQGSAASAASFPSNAPVDPVPMSAMEAAQMLQGRAGLLRAPTVRPDEPVTAGLPVGPGPGPEMLGRIPMENPTGKFFRELAKATGNPYYAELAAKLRL